MKQLIFAVESDSRAKTDDRYIYKLVLYRYDLSDKDTKIQFVHMGEKNKFDDKSIRKQINNYINENRSGKNVVLYCFDTGKIDHNQTDIKTFKAEKDHCHMTNSELIWFNYDIEYVLLGKHIDSSIKLKESIKILGKNMVRINISNLKCENENCCGKATFISFLTNSLSC